MIKLETKSMSRAIERAKAVHPKVRVISASDRVYAVTGRAGNDYTVRFAVAGGHRLGSCDCPARGLCYHIAAAASVNIAVQSMRRGIATPAAPRIVRSIESDRTGVKVVAVRCDDWLI